MWRLWNEMANDRMWLVHKPTGKMALIAKHFEQGWKEYTGPRHPPFYSIQGLFDECGQDTEYVVEYESLQ
jgi:hypothetical protein